MAFSQPGARLSSLSKREPINAFLPLDDESAIWVAPCCHSWKSRSHSADCRPRAPRLRPAGRGKWVWDGAALPFREVLRTAGPAEGRKPARRPRRHWRSRRLNAVQKLLTTADLGKQGKQGKRATPLRATAANRSRWQSRAGSTTSAISWTSEPGIYHPKACFVRRSWRACERGAPSMQLTNPVCTSWQAVPE